MNCCNVLEFSSSFLILFTLYHRGYSFDIDAMSSAFSIRPATLEARDDKRVLSYFDSQLQWLETVGSGAQWGSTPRGHKEDMKEKYRSKIERSEACIGKPFGPDWIQAYIMEAEVDVDSVNAELRQLATVTGDGRCARVPVAAMILQAKSADYVRSILPEQDDEDPFVFLHYLLSDRRTSSINKGAGAALIRHAKDETKELGLRRITADCWRGNDRKLVK